MTRNILLFALITTNQLNQLFLSFSSYNIRSCLLIQSLVPATTLLFKERKSTRASANLKVIMPRRKGKTTIQIVQEQDGNEANTQGERCKGESSGGSKGESADASTENKKSKWEPKNWQTVLENIKMMRAGKDAIVDSMGCERTMEDHVDPKTKRYQTLVSLMLSSQTKDQITYAAMKKLQQDIGLTIETILKTDEGVIGQAIKPVSFWNRKAKYIKNTTEILRNQYNDDIPDTINGLCSLPGVGPKMAYICMNVAWNQNAGIGVDTHVHRIANRLQWTGPKESKTPEKTREGLESWLDPNLWQEINILLVGFGQTICAAVKPKCSECLNNELCPFGKSYLKNTTSNKKKSKKSSKGKKEEDEDSDDGDGDDDETSEYF